MSHAFAISFMNVLYHDDAELPWMCRVLVAFEYKVYRYIAWLRFVYTSLGSIISVELQIVLNIIWH